MSSSNKVIVIGKGRFGNATAQGLREGFIEGVDGKRMKCDVVQVSATRFTSLSVSEMADELTGQPICRIKVWIWVLLQLLHFSIEYYYNYCISQRSDTAIVAYCGTRLSEYAVRIALAIQEATKQSSGPALEFIDFSNPDPIHEKADVSGALDLWAALNTQGKDEEATKNEGSAIKVWKITDVGSADVSGITSNTGKSSMS